MRKQYVCMLLVLCMIATLLPVSALAPTSGTCGANLNWNVTNDGVLTISGTGPMRDYAKKEDFGTVYGDQPWQGTGIAFKTVILEQGVTSIGVAAFYSANSHKLVSVSIPDTVTYIGKRAFACCPSLISISIPYGVTSIESETFDECTSLSSVSIPDSVTQIGTFAFGSCESLSSIVLPSNLTTIESAAFMGCSNLSSIKIPDSVTTIYDQAFEGCAFSTIEIPNALNEIPLGMFQRCKNLISVTIPNSITSIHSSAFNACDALSDVYFDGSREQWDAIEIESHNEPLKNATIHFSIEAPNPAPEFAPTPSTPGDVVSEPVPPTLLMLPRHLPLQKQ